MAAACGGWLDAVEKDWWTKYCQTLEERLGQQKILGTARDTEIL